MQEPFVDDIESGGPYNDTPASSSQYFWTKKKLYEGEWRTYLVPVPLWRAIATLILIYTFAYSCDFIDSLCTQASKFTCAVTLLACTGYFGWAIWWDVPYAVPPTWTFIKRQGFNACWVLTWLIYNAVLIGLAVFVCVLTVVINYGDLEEIFKWECFRR